MKQIRSCTPEPGSLLFLNKNGNLILRYTTEFTNDGQFIGQLSIDSVPGAAFGIAIVPVSTNTARIALVNDDDNTIIVQTLNTGG